MGIWGTGCGAGKVHKLDTCQREARAATASGLDAQSVKAKGED